MITNMGSLPYIHLGSSPTTKIPHDINTYLADSTLERYLVVHTWKLEKCDMLSNIQNYTLGYFTDMVVIHS